MDFSTFDNYVKNLKFKTFYGFITRTWSLKTKLLSFFLVNTQTEKHHVVIQIPFGDLKNWIDLIQLDKNVFKAIMVDVFDMDTVDTEFKSNYMLRTALKEKLDKLQIPNYFIAHEDVTISTYLIAANINIEFEETILIVSQPSPENMSVIELKFTEFGYERIRAKKYVSEFSREKILGTSNPRKIILWENEKNITVKKLLKSRKLIELNQNIGKDHFDNVIAEICRWILNKSHVKYFIMPIYRRTVNVCSHYGLHSTEILLLSAEHGEKLPYTKATTFPRSVFGCSAFFITDKDVSKLGPEFERNCHRFQVTLSINSESKESVLYQREFIYQIQVLPQQLDDSRDPKKLPVIGFFHNSSVILIHDKLNGYNFLESWNGIFGIDLFISFDRKKQKYFKDAWKMLEDKHSFVVFDLLKIMSMPSDNIEISNTWGFTITNDSENPVLLQFDNFDGTRKAASPQFLMAVLLRKHLKSIEEKIGEKPEEVKFWIYNDDEKRFDEEEINRIKEGLKESCKLLNICCSFFNC